MTLGRVALAIVVALVPTAAGAQTLTLADAAGRTVARLDAHRETVKVRDGRDQAMGDVKVQADRVRLSDAGGAELRDGGGKTLAKVKARANGLVFESEAGARLGEISGVADVRSGLWFALDRFSPAERAALWAFFANVAR
jgi:hypothetical protein